MRLEEQEAERAALETRAVRRWQPGALVPLHFGAVTVYVDFVAFEAGRSRRWGAPARNLAVRWRLAGLYTVSLDDGSLMAGRSTERARYRVDGRALEELRLAWHAWHERRHRLQKQLHRGAVC